MACGGWGGGLFSNMLFTFETGSSVEEVWEF